MSDPTGIYPKIKPKTYHFLTGLPRSGSTVLASILNQHPNVYVTPTSPLIDLLIANQNNWRSNPCVQANYFPEQLTNITKAMITAAWQHRPEEIIIDKSRGWMKNMLSANYLFDKKMKAIVTVRDLPSIMASWLTLLHKNPDSGFDKECEQIFGYVNDEIRVEYMWQTMVKDCFNGLETILREARDQCLVVRYDDLIDHPTYEIDRIHWFLGYSLPKKYYDLDNIQNDTQDDDLKAWGLNGMHTIRPQLKKVAQDPKIVLGSKLYDILMDIQNEFNI
jgi:sulfotransferase